ESLFCVTLVVATPDFRRRHEKIDASPRSSFSSSNGDKMTRMRPSVCEPSAGCDSRRALAGKQGHSVAEDAPEPYPALGPFEVDVETGVDRTRKPVRQDPSEQRSSTALSCTQSPGEADQHVDSKRELKQSPQYQTGN